MGPGMGGACACVLMCMHVYARVDVCFCVSG
jgi:hypothetical protein